MERVVNELVHHFILSVHHIVGREADTFVLSGHYLDRLHRSLGLIGFGHGLLYGSGHLFRSNLVVFKLNDIVATAGEVDTL